MWGKEDIGGGRVVTCKEVLYKNSCALVSFARMDQLKYIMGAASSVYFDNGAFSDWKKNDKVNRPPSHWAKYYALVMAYYSRIDGFFIPDVIEGSEEQNDVLVDSLPSSIACKAIPVWHSVESLDRLERLCRRFDKVALGFCGPHEKIYSHAAFERLQEVFEFIYVKKRIDVKVHGLRMLDSRVLGRFPFSSADSAYVSVNVPKDRQQMPEVKCKLARTAIYKNKIEVVTPPTVEQWVSDNAPSTKWVLVSGGDHIVLEVDPRPSMPKGTPWHEDKKNGYIVVVAQ